MCAVIHVGEFRRPEEYLNADVLVPCIIAPGVSNNIGTAPLAPG